MRKIVLNTWISVECALWLACAQCGNLTTEEFYNELSRKLRQEALNCIPYIPQQWRTWMQEHEPPSDPENTGNGKRHVLPRFEYLSQCLHAELANMNETPPFSLTLHPTIAYGMVLNEVVSLGFDGTLVTKACVFCNLLCLKQKVWLNK